MGNINYKKKTFAECFNPFHRSKFLNISLWYRLDSILEKFTFSPQITPSVPEEGESFPLRESSAPCPNLSDRSCTAFTRLTWQLFSIVHTLLVNVIYGLWSVNNTQDWERKFTPWKHARETALPCKVKLPPSNTPLSGRGLLSMLSLRPLTAFSTFPQCWYFRPVNTRFASVFLSWN